MKRRSTTTTVTYKCHIGSKRSISIENYDTLVFFADIYNIGQSAARNLVENYGGDMPMDLDTFYSLVENNSLYGTDLYSDRMQHTYTFCQGISGRIGG